MQSPTPRQNGESGKPLPGPAFSEEWLVAPIWTRIERKLDRLLLVVIFVPPLTIFLTSYVLPILVLRLFGLFGSPAS